MSMPSSPPSTSADVPCATIGRTLAEPEVRVRVGERQVLAADMRDLRDLWEATSFRLELVQANPECVAAERDGLRERTAPPYALSYTPAPTPAAVLEKSDKIPVAILREEGSNGDREMAAAFLAAGFEPWDVAMSDLLAGRITLDRFRGVVAVGGFTYADVLDVGQGLGRRRSASTTDLWAQFEAFLDRPDTFSLGVCNGCQLLALLGWVPWRGLERRRPTALRPQRLGPLRVALRDRHHPDEPGHHAARHGGLDPRHLVRPRRGARLFPDADDPRPGRGGEPRPDPLRRRRRPGHRGVPLQPQRLAAGIAGLCSPDGRHLAMMPHPERTFLTVAVGLDAAGLARDLEVSPWLRMFQNAREWCEERLNVQRSNV